LVPSGGLFWGFFPPSNEQLLDTFQTFLESGIHGYWIEEFYGMGLANRVQERSKVKSPTAIAAEEKKSSFSPLRLGEGHVVTVFVLGGFGLSFSGIVLVVEIFMKSITKKDVYPVVLFYIK